MRSIVKCGMIAVTLVLASCFPSGKKQQEEKTPEEFYSLVYEFDSLSGLSGMSEHGLEYNENGRLVAVIQEMGSTLWSIKTDGKSERKFLLPGVVEYDGFKMNVEFGLLNADGKLFGVTNAGGKNDKGTIYMVNPVSGNFTVHYDFDGEEALHPNALPVYNGDSLLYGLAERPVGRGFVWYTYNINSRKITNVVKCTSDNVNMASSAVQYQAGPDGLIYANDMLGYQGEFGYVFRIEKDLVKDKKIHEFDSISGNAPAGNMVFLNGKIYGTASGGGIKDNGLVYSMNMDGTDYKVLARFDGDNGHLPEGLILASDGMLYGTCYSYGKYDTGSMYRLATDGSKFQVFWHFKEETGGYPNGKLVEGEKGKIYGLARHGGKHDRGALFCVDLNKIPSADVQ